MTRTQKKLATFIMAMLVFFFNLEMLLPGQISASASDTSLYLNQEVINLVLNYTPTAEITGKIAGDTSSKYYVYGVDDYDVVSEDTIDSFF